MQICPQQWTVFTGSMRKYPFPKCNKYINTCYNLKSRFLSQVSSIKTFDFSTLYTTLPHDKLKTRLKETIHKAFNHRNYGSTFVVLGYNSTYL